MSIALLNYTKIDPQTRHDIYDAYDSFSIIQYLEPLTADVFTVRFIDYHFDESIFPSLGEKWLLKMSRKKLIELHYGYMHMILALLNVNLKFKGSLNCRILQMKYLMCSLILKE